ncbi:glycosyltransferase [Marinitoga litoralis]|uniref:glycosyltransferase n=1 Tax=Marinitoga litoralis TaxID=570855 RepID=UPI001960CAEE|nr:glycosyltransferase [Marinitoga litoralis]MBM7560133.1 glycosyltransferase involved in cell wall biosynthesis [Marinitoga litoralis]
MKNILILDHAYWFGGAEKVLVDYLKRHDKSKYNIIVGVTTESEFTEKLKEINVDYKVFPLSKDFLKISRSKISFKNIINIFEYKSMINSISDFVKENNIDIIFTNSMKAHIYGGQVAKKTNVKAIARIHDVVNGDFISPLKSAIKRVFNNYFYHISCVSETVKNSLIRIGVNENKLSVLYNGIPDMVPKYNEEYYRRLYNLSENDFIISVIGWIQPSKGQLEIIKSLKDILNNNIKLMIIGDANEKNKDYLEKIKKYIELNNLSNNVLLIGHTDDVSGHLELTNVFIHYPYIDDSLPTVLIEALYHKKIIIARNIGGIPEIINEKNGYLVDDIHEIKDIIMNIYKSPEKYSKEIDSDYFHNKFSYEKYIKGIEELFEK